MPFTNLDKVFPPTVTPKGEPPTPVFPTVLHIVLALALVAFFVGTTFWQLEKRANFLQRIIKEVGVSLIRRIQS